MLYSIFGYCLFECSPSHRSLNTQNASTASNCGNESEILLPSGNKVVSDDGKGQLLYKS